MGLTLCRYFTRPEKLEPEVSESQSDEPNPVSLWNLFRRLRLIGTILSPLPLETLYVMPWERSHFIRQTFPDLCVQALLRQTETHQLVQHHIFGLSSWKFGYYARAKLSTRRTLVIIILSPPILRLIRSKSVQRYLREGQLELDYEQAHPDWLHPNVLVGQPRTGPLFGPRTNFLYVNHLPNQNQLVWIREHFPRLRTIHLVHSFTHWPDTTVLIERIDQLYQDPVLLVSVNNWPYEVRRREDGISRRHFLFVGFLPNAFHRHWQVMRRNENVILLDN